MKVKVLICLFYLSLIGHSQVTVLNNTNLNGFAMTNTTGTITKYNQSYGVSFTGIYLGTCHLDTTLNLTCYDSLKVIYTAWRTLYTSSASVNGSVVTLNTPSTYTFATLNISNLTLSVTAAFALMNPYGYLYITGLKIIGYQSIISCTIAPSQPITIFGPTVVCAGATSFYSITPICGANNYSWTLPGGWTGTSTSNVITTTAGVSAGTLSVTASNGCGSSLAQTVNVIVNSIPSTPTAINGLNNVCAGSTSNYSIAIVSGATSYSWNFPVGWGGNSNTNNISLTPNNNSGNISVTASNLCGASSPQVLSVTVNPLPSVYQTSSASMICVGESATLTAFGANSYTWNLGQITNSITISPTVNTTYTVIGTDLNGCTNTSTFTQIVSTCVGIELLEINESSFQIFPNPFSGQFTIATSEEKPFSIEVYNMLGLLVYCKETKMNNIKINLSNIRNGIYFVRVSNDEGSFSKKIIKE